MVEKSNVQSFEAQAPNRSLGDQSNPAARVKHKIDCITKGNVIACMPTIPVSKFDFDEYDRVNEWVAAKSDVSAKIAELTAIWSRSDEKYAIKSILNLKWFLTLAFATLICCHLLAMQTFLWKGLNDNGDLSLPLFYPEALQSINPAYVMSGTWFVIGLLLIVAIVGAIHQSNKQTGRRAAEAVRDFYDQEIDQHWVKHLKEVVSMIGAGNREEVKDEASTYSLYAIRFWRRIERFAARAEPIWTFYRLEREDQRKNKWAPIILYFPIAAIFISNFYHARALTDGVTVEIYVPLFKLHFIFSALAMILIVLIYRALHESAICVADKIEAAIAQEDVPTIRRRRRAKKTAANTMRGLNTREKRYAEHDPMPLILDRYKTALDQAAKPLG